MNVAFVISSLTAGGAERVLSNLANELVEDFNITIITLYKCQPFYPLHKEINLKYCKEHSIDSPTTLQSLVNHCTLFYNLNKLLKNHQIDICIGFMSTSNLYAILASKLRKIPSIISERIHPEYYDIGAFWNFIREKIYPLATHLVIQTESIKKYFETYMTSEQLRIIKNPLAPNLASKRNLNGKREKIILNIGRLDNQKNQDLLIRAFANIHQDGWILNIIGEGVNRKIYEDLIESLHLENKVKLLGIRSDVHSYFNQAGIFVFTSRFEGFPNALTEAMYFGVPCISTDCPSGPSELIQNGFNGYLIPVGDQLSLEKRLQELIDSPDLRMRFAANAIKNTDEFESELVTNQWKSLIMQSLK